MKIKKIITILTFFLLFSCGFEPIYSKKKLDNSYNFTISNIVFSGENKVNQNLKNNLKNYINIETKPIKYDLVINSSSVKIVTSKNKKGNPELFSIEITINVDINKAGNLINQTFRPSILVTLPPKKQGITYFLTLKLNQLSPHLLVMVS